MNKEIALDSSVLIDHLRNVPAIKERIEAYDSLYIPVPVIAEIMVGIYQLKESESRMRSFGEFVSNAQIIDCTM